MSDSAVRQAYDKQAKNYDCRWRRYIGQTLTFLNSWADIAESATVLDVGCGTGEFERLLLDERPNQRVVGVDLSEEMLRVAREKCRVYPNVTFIHASASQLPFPDQHFDTIVSASALHYFAEPDKCLREMHRVLKRRGSLAILDWCKDYLLCRFYDAAFKLTGTAYKSSYSEWEFHRMLTSAGFQVRTSKKARLTLVGGVMIATAIA
jgi:ubiquinone/menaquinone biosynthesis C-methylase UbiE